MLCVPVTFARHFAISIYLHRAVLSVDNAAECATNKACREFTLCTPTIYCRRHAKSQYFQACCKSHEYLLTRQIKLSGRYGTHKRANIYTYLHVAVYVHIFVCKCLNLLIVYSCPAQPAILYALLPPTGVFVVVNQCLLHINTNLQV